jgi:hypothetical protein
MLPPITEQEKAVYTLRLQLEKGTEELLVEAYESGYTGYIDIWPVVNPKKNKIIMEIASKKVLQSVSPMSHKEAMRYHVQQGKGYKRIK